MRALLLIAFGIVIFQNVQAQGFKTSLLFSPGISRYNSTNLDIRNRDMKFCFSGGIREEYFFERVFSLGLELEYLNISGSFISATPPINTIPIPEEYSHFKHIFSVNSIEIPLFFRLRTKGEVTKGISFYFGTGLSKVLNADRDITLESGYMGLPPAEIIPVANGKVKIKNGNNNQLGTIGVLGVGKHFAIKNKTFFCEIKYRFDLNNWVYPTFGDPMNKSFDIKRRCLLLNVGITF